MPDPIRTGYDKTFLGEDTPLPMPSVSLELEDDVLRNDSLRDETIADYVHYSVVMSASSKQALFSAANLDQSQYVSVQGRRWFVDPRIGADHQIGPEAYARNDWDRGHLTRRTAVTWGNRYVAKRASNDSCSYGNACLQHANFNQDEWRVPEEIVRHFQRDRNNRLCIFTGPVFTETDRWYTRDRWHPSHGTGPVRIPSGFWKVVAYVGKESGQLECQGYVMYQDEQFLADRRGQHRLDSHNYQVTITEIERLTGLDFPEELFDSNPLYFYRREGINEGPEGFRVPPSLEPTDLAAGVVFSRADAEGTAFTERRRTLTEAQFEEMLAESGMTG